MTSLRRWRFTITLGLATSALLLDTAAISAAQEAGAHPETLMEAVESALAFHPSVGVATAVAEGASARIGEAKAGWLPQVIVEGQGTRFEEPMVVAPLHAFDPSRPPVFDQTLLRSTIALEYRLFDGARSPRIAQASAASAAARADRRVAETELIAQVTRAYLAVVSAKGVVRARETHARALEAELERVTQLREEGLAAHVQVLRADAAIATAEADLLTARTALETAARELTRLTGGAEESAWLERAPPVRVNRAREVADLASLENRALEVSPRVQGARQRAAAAESGHRAARAAWIPSLDVAGGFLTYGTGSGGFSSEWQAGLRLSYPLFTGGSRSSRVAQAGALARSADEGVRREVLLTRRVIDMAVAELRSSAARVTALSSAVRHLREVVRIERLALDEGVGTQTDYLRSSADLARAEAQLIEARNGEVVAHVELARGVGDLTLEWLARNVEVEP